jgi:prepilin-type N-terminal cleavage/methylation domain-containing protein
VTQSTLTTASARIVRHRNGFSLVELIVALVLLAFGVLGFATTTTFAIRQVSLADVSTERSAAYQHVIERLRATSPNTITSGTEAIGSYTVSWSVTDSTGLSKTVQVITLGPGLSRGMGVGLPSLQGNVYDTVTMLVLR